MWILDHMWMDIYSRNSPKEDGADTPCILVDDNPFSAEVPEDKQHIKYQQCRTLTLKEQ